jgi:hypothetical protein
VCPQAIHIDRAPALRDDKFCYGKRDGVMPYRGDDRPSYLGDLHVGKYIGDELAKRSKAAPKALQ